MRKKRLYPFTLLACLMGYAWLLWNEKYDHVQDTGSGLCLFRHITGIPCPSCGTTHALLSLLHFHFSEAFYFNPLGYVLAIAMLVIPVWIIIDGLARKESFYIFYRHTETLMRKRWMAIPLILLIAGNWLWNIYKYAH